MDKGKSTGDEDDLKPRRVPRPTVFPQNVARATVPEVSLVINPAKYNVTGNSERIDTGKPQYDLHNQYLRGSLLMKPNKMKNVTSLGHAPLNIEEMKQLHQDSSPNLAVTTNSVQFSSKHVSSSNSNETRHNANVIHSRESVKSDCNLSQDQMRSGCDTKMRKLTVGSSLGSCLVQDGMCKTVGNPVCLKQQYAVNDDFHDHSKPSYLEQHNMESKERCTMNMQQRNLEYRNVEHKNCESSNTQHCTLQESDCTMKSKSDNFSHLPSRDAAKFGNPKNFSPCNYEANACMAEKCFAISNKKEHGDGVHCHCSNRQIWSSNDSCSMNLFQAHCETNKEITNILKQLLNVNQTHTQLLSEILQKVIEWHCYETSKKEGSNNSENVTSARCGPDLTSSKRFVSDCITANTATQTTEGTAVSVGVMTEQAEAEFDIHIAASSGPYKDREHQKFESAQICTQPQDLAAVHHAPVDESLTLHGVDMLTLPEQAPSPLPSLHLDMQDFRDSSDEDKESDTEYQSQAKGSSHGQHATSEESNRASWTLYNNVVGQVNKFLQSAPCTSQQIAKEVAHKEDICSNVEQLRNLGSAEAVRIATIEQIRKLGVSFYDGSTEIEEFSTTRRVKFDSVLHPYKDAKDLNEKNDLDTSTQINALALKYLKDDELNELMDTVSGQKGMHMSSAGQKATDMSLASQRYLEKYQLLPPVGTGNSSKIPRDLKRELKGEKFHQKEKNIKEVAKKGVEIFTRHSRPTRQGTDKILDISVLKQQPKLL